MTWNDLIPPVLMAPGAHPGWRVALALLPVLLMLAALVGLDSFRLVRGRRVAAALGAGGAAALVAYVGNTLVLEVTALSATAFAVGVAPVVEEGLKGLWVAGEIRAGRVGFLVDAAILGFATGAGFAVVENVYYLHLLGDVPLVVFAIRGLGTALMHGGTTAILAVILRGRSGTGRLLPAAAAGLALAVVVHAAFNHLMRAPVPTTLALAVGMPLLLLGVYRQGERRLRAWLGEGFDRDRELLGLIRSGQVHASPLGQYLLSLRTTFPADLVADMLCLLRLQVELSLRAKGTLLLRAEGLRPRPDPDLPGKLDEVRHLEHRIGRTGQLALRPVCHWQGADRWQSFFVSEENRG